MVIHKIKKNIVQLTIRYMFIKVLTKDITEDAFGKFIISIIIIILSLSY